MFPFPPSASRAGGPRIRNFATDRRQRRIVIEYDVPVILVHAELHHHLRDINEHGPAPHGFVEVEQLRTSGRLVARPQDFLHTPESRIAATRLVDRTQSGLNAKASVGPLPNTNVTEQPEGCATPIDPAVAVSPIQPALSNRRL